VNAAGTVVVLAILALGGCAMDRGEQQRAPQACQLPEERYSPPLSLDSLQLQNLAGHYALTVAETSGYPGDSTIYGHLWLSPTEPDRRGPRERPYPLAGWSDVDLESLAPVSLAYPASQRDPGSPGVQMEYDTRDLNLILVFGAASVGTQFYEDAGVIFRVFAVDSMGFRGRWVDGGARAPLPRGYFCADRAD
jgi:hypothetical protein